MSPTVYGDGGQTGNDNATHSARQPIIFLRTTKSYLLN